MSVKALRKQQIAGTIADRLLDLIQAGEVRPGEPMRAQHFANRFEVSRFPVTEAFRLLAEQGFAEHRPNRGFFVAQSARDTKNRFTQAMPVGEAAYAMIADDYLNGRLPQLVTGTFLGERYRLNRYQLSALMTRIEAEGWVTRRSGHGWRFSEMLRTPEALEQTYRVRLAIEPAAILEPAFDLPPAHLKGLKDVEIQLLAGGIDVLPPEKLYAVGVGFHETIMEASRNPFFLETLRRLNRIRRLIAYRSMGTRDRYYKQAEEHLEILDWLERGNAAAAADAMRRHLSHVVHSLRQLRDGLSPAAHIAEGSKTALPETACKSTDGSA